MTESAAPVEARRILALDLGRARIGVAISDGLGLTAQPLLTILHKTMHADLKSIGRIIRKHAVAEIVVGHPLHASGDASSNSTRAAGFAVALRAEFALPVHLWDERLTTHAAHELLDETESNSAHTAAARIARKKIVDQLAAVLILESFLAARTHSAGRGKSA
jgi:putative Holliday junction resolvase